MDRMLCVISAHYLFWKNGLATTLMIDNSEVIEGESPDDNWNRTNYKVGWSEISELNKLRFSLLDIGACHFKIIPADLRC